MPEARATDLLDAILDSWDRNNTILVNLLRALPADALGSRSTPDGPTDDALGPLMWGVWMRKTSPAP